MWRVVEGVAALIRIDALWLNCGPSDARAGADTLLACVVQVFGSAQAYHGYMFTNAWVTRIKLLVHDCWRPLESFYRSHQLGLRPPSDKTSLA